MKYIKLVNTTEYAIVDDEDFLYLSQFTWYILKSKHTNYARTIINGKHFNMHTLLMGKKDYDHKNNNGLDNQRKNLREATRSQQAANTKNRDIGKTSCYRGVRYEKDRSKWRASITINNTGINLGRYNTEIEAAKVYDKAALAAWGEFAELNFKDESLKDDMRYLT